VRAAAIFVATLGRQFVHRPFPNRVAESASVIAREWLHNELKEFDLSDDRLRDN
jgi:hypothetical protein